MLRKLLSLLPDADLGKGASAKAIAAAELKLGVRFPRSYRKFLRTIGWLESSVLTVHGLGGPSHLNVVRCTLADRRAGLLPSSLCDLAVVIVPDGRGGFHLLDTAHSAGGECRVVYFDHELVGPRYKGQVAGKTFATFLTHQLREHVPPQRMPEVDGVIARARRKIESTRRAFGHKGKMGASSAEVAAAEKVLNVDFPQPVRELLRAMGGTGVGDFDYILGVQHGLAPDLALVATSNRLWRRRPVPLPRRLLPIHYTAGGYDWVRCIDLSSESKCDVVVWHLKSGQLDASAGRPLAKELASWARSGIIS